MLGLPIVLGADHLLGPPSIAGRAEEPGKVAGGVSGNSVESRQHQEDKVEVGDRARSTDPDATPNNQGRTGKTSSAG